MKKQLCLVLALVMIMALFSGCGQQAVPEPAAPVSAAPSEAAPAEAPSEEQTSEAAPVEEVKGWEPTSTIELVVGSSAGGGADRYARMFADLAYQYGWIPEPMVINYQTGATGNIAYNYVLSKGDDPYTIMGTVNSYDVAAILNDSPIKIEDMGVLGVTVADDLVVVVGKDSPYKTLDELFEGMRQNPGKISWSGGIIGTMEHVGYMMLCDVAGVEGSYVGFDGQSDAISALLGGHLDVGVFVPSVVNGYFESGDFIPLASLTDKPLGGDLSYIPVAKDIGYDVQASLARGILCCPKMPEEAKAFYEDLIAKVVNTPEWHEYTSNNLMSEIYMNAEEGTQYLSDSAKNVVAMLSANGLI